MYTLSGQACQRGNLDGGSQHRPVLGVANRAKRLIGFFFQVSEGDEQTFGRRGSVENELLGDPAGETVFFIENKFCASGRPVYRYKAAALAIEKRRLEDVACTIFSFHSSGLPRMHY